MAFKYIGSSSTLITNGGTENPTINGVVVTTKHEGDIVFYTDKRFLWTSDNVWIYQGDIHTHTDVQDALNTIAEAYKGEEVRGSIYDAIALIDTRSSAMEDVVGQHVEPIVEDIVDDYIDVTDLVYTIDNSTIECNKSYEQITEILSNNKQLVFYVSPSFTSSVYLCTGTIAPAYSSEAYLDVKLYYIDYDYADVLHYCSITHFADRIRLNGDTATTIQAKLTAGTNIEIDPITNTISATGGDNQPLYIKNGSTNSCTMSYSEVMSILNDSGKIFRPQLKVSGTTGSSSYNGTYEFIEYVIPSANYVWLWFKSTIMEQTQEDAPLYYKPSFILIEHKSDGEVRFRMQTFAEYQAKLTAGDGIDISYNNISLSDPTSIKLTVNQGSIVSSFDYTTNPVTEFTTNFVANPIDIADLVTDRFSAAKLALNADTSNDSLKCTVVNTDYREMDSSPYFKEFVWIYFLYDRSFYRFDYTIIYSDEIRGTVSEISGAITKISTVSNGTGLSLSGNTLSTKLKANGGILADSDGLYADTSKIQAKLTPGTNITIDNTDPANPVISSTGGGGGSSYTEGNGIDIDSNNVISVSPKANGGITVDSNGVSVDTSKVQAKLTAGTNITIDNTDPANPVISSTGGGGGSSYTAGAGIDIDSNNTINTVRIKIAHLDVTRTPSINYTWTEIQNLLGPYTAYGSATCYLWYGHTGAVFDTAIGSYNINNSGITIQFTCIYGNTIEHREYYLSSENVLSMIERTTTNYQPKLSAGTGISIDPTTNTISLDLPQAEGGGF